MAKILSISFVLILYFLVFFVALENGPLVSIQSLILCIAGMIAIIIILSALAQKINLVDISDNFRKRHKGRVPLVGGLALYISLIYGATIFGVDTFYNTILISLIPIIFVSIIDDLRGAPISFRLIAQILASWIVILFSDIYIRDLGLIFSNDIFKLGQFGIPFTIFAVVGMSNAFNMLDGMNGIVGSVGLVCLLGISVLSIYNGQNISWELLLMIGLFVFLLFNLGIFNSANRIFLGDHGSITVGYILSWNLIFLSQDPVNIITPASALWFVALPLLDSLITMYRRYKSSESIMFADRNHFHHWLSDRGLSDNSVLFVITMLSSLGVFLAVVVNFYKAPETIIMYGFLSLLISLIILDKYRQ